MAISASKPLTLSFCLKINGGASVETPTRKMPGSASMTVGGAVAQAHRTMLQVKMEPSSRTAMASVFPVACRGEAEVPLIGSVVRVQQAYQVCVVMRQSLFFRCGSAVQDLYRDQRGHSERPPVHLSLPLTFKVLLEIRQPGRIFDPFDFQLDQLVGLSHGIEKIGGPVNHLGISRRHGDAQRFIGKRGDQ